MYNIYVTELFDIVGVILEMDLEYKEIKMMRYIMIDLKEKIYFR